MSNADNHHFDEYREQNRVKHQIISKYLLAYFRVLQTWKSEIFFIDGFAGRGHYDDPTSGAQFEGSPILALNAINRDDKLKKCVRTWFIEANPEYFQNLNSSVQSFCKYNKGLISPTIQHGKFAQVLGPILKEIDGTENSIKPTFLFVDPCGVDGVDLDVISSILKHPGCEVLIFFNYSGINRICGLFDTERNTPSLVKFFGSTARVDGLRTQLSGLADPGLREQIIVRSYLDALTSDGKAEFLIPFRVECEDRKSTSHYLIHACKHPLGFKIMKDIMWDMSRDATGEGSLELLQASKSDAQLFIRPDLQALDTSVLKHLRNVDKELVGTFKDEWVRRKDDFFSGPCYKRRLLDLEDRGLIRVLDKDGKNPAPREKRRKWKGEPTLASEYYVQIV